MSIFDWVVDTAEGGLAWAFGKNKANKDSDKQMKEQNRLINEQIQAYKDQTALTQKELNDLKAQKDVERRRIDEKQIRSLRGQYRPAGGFLNNQSLGNEGVLPNKLGTA